MFTGTGTPIGDPTESNALGAFFSNNKKSKRQLYIGSVKSNIGHLESAAGIAGLMKVLLMMKHGMIVPSLMYTKANGNPKIDFDGYGLIVPTKCLPWPEPPTKVRTACVNSFGFGGTNAHAIIHDFKAIHHDTDDKIKPPYVVTLSAYNQESLKENVNQFLQDLNHTQTSMPSLAFTSTCKRHHMPVRKAFVVETKHQLTELCLEFLKLTVVKRKRKPEKQIVFVFSGVGTLWNGVGKALMSIPEFSDAVKAVDVILKPLAGWSIRRKFEGNLDLVSDPLVSHISIFACQIGLAAIWESYGIRPHAVVGQSVGEVAAACVAGQVDLVSAIHIIFHRSKLLSETVGGAMVFVNKISVEQMEAYCKSKAGKINIAVYNSPVSCTVSGDKDAINAMKSDLQVSSPDAVIVDLNVSCAYHSHHVDVAAKRIVGKLKQIKGKGTDVFLYSTVTGKQELNGRLATGQYWAQNMRQPVLFSDAVKASASVSKNNLFLEIGPGPVLRVHAPALFDDNTTYDVLPSVTKDKALQTLLQTTCKLYEHGCEICWNKIASETKGISELPKYIFWKQKTLYQNPDVVLRNQGVDNDDKSHLFLERLADIDACPQFNAKINTESTPFIFEHVVAGNILVPGAFHADAGFEIGAACFNLSHAGVCVSLEFLRPIRLEKQGSQILSISSSRDDAKFTFIVKQGETQMCKGMVCRSGGQSSDRLNLTELKQRFVNGTHYSHDELYTKLKMLGFEYGSSFRIIQNCTAAENTCFAECRLPPEVMANTSRTILHPCILDSLFQSTMTITDDESWEMITQEKLAVLPVAVEQITVRSKPVYHMFIYTKRTNATVMDTVFKVHYNSILFDLNGNTIAEIENYTTYSKRNAQNAPDDLRYSLIWQKNFPVGVSDSKRILCITNSTDQDIPKELQGESVVVCRPKSSSNQSCEDLVAHSTEMVIDTWGTKQNIEAIMVVFDKFQFPNDLSSQKIEKIYQQAMDNCWLIVALIKHLIEEDLRRPLFIVTQNTQNDLVFDENDTTNVVGSELWGFIRSLQVEFVYGEITVVDLKPTLKETKKSLLEFVNAAVENIDAYKTEIVLCHDRIYSSTFRKTSAAVQMPYFRRMQQRITDDFSVRSKRAKSITDPFVIHGDKTHTMVDNIEKKSIYLRVKSLYHHPPLLYVSTLSAFNGVINVWDESDLGGHNVLGIEIVGYQLDTNRRRLFQCRTGKVEPEPNVPENVWEYIAVYPVEVASVVCVPKTCTISMKDVPFYQPGLLLNSIIAWEISENAQSYSKVIVKAGDGDALLGLIIREMLITRKRVSIIDNPGEEKPDVVISVCEHEDDYTTLQTAKSVICFKNALPADIFKRLVIKDGMDILEIDTSSLLKRDKIATLLRKSVPWLKKNFPKLGLKCNNLQHVEKHAASDTKTNDMNRIEISNLPSMIPQNSVFGKMNTYIITGGLTGLGWELLLLVAEMGAGTIATLSRRNVSAEKLSEIDDIQQKYACKIICLQADVTDLESLQTAIATLQSAPGCGSIKGILHGAGALDSRLLIRLTRKQLDNVMKPKVKGTMNIHLATQHLQLDYFLVQSSISSFIGAPGQSNYGAGNSFMDAFAKWRRSIGLQAQSINWGALSVGMAANPDFLENFEKRGHNLLSVPEIRCCFLQAIMENSTDVVYTSLDWRLVAKDFSNPNMSRIKLKVDTVIAEQVAGGYSSSDDDITNGLDIELIRQADEKVQRETLNMFVQGIARRILENDIESYTMSSTFSEIGLDSMSSMTFTNIVYEYTRCRIDVRFLYEPDRTLSDIVTYLMENLINNYDISETRAPKLVPVDDS